MFISRLLVIMNCANDILTTLCYVKKLDDGQEECCVKLCKVGTDLNLKESVL
jgi:hypothetical protein